ncbi:MAG: ATP-dependent RecD-like DNA helicase [Sporomusaceae bacterium]|nr:ATP-dependent RecD-like DNA helicase [Sporomusaceae bacterium]
MAEIPTTIPTDSTEEKVFLSGTVERVTFHNDDNGFCVLRVKARGFRDLVTVVGHASTITSGEFIEAIGLWKNDPQYGLQLSCISLKSTPPTTLEGIQKYLSSGLVKGIGPVYGERLVNCFGLDVFTVIEQTPHRLREVDGIGKVRSEKIVKGWDAQKKIKEIMLFLYSNGVGTSKAVRIYKTYGDKAISLIQENPYRLAQDIYGIGFVTADTIAQKIGVEKNSLIRAKAGIRHALFEEVSNGNCAYPKAALLPQAVELLEIPLDILEQAIIEEIETQGIMIDTIGDEECLFIPSLYYYEKYIAERIVAVASGSPLWGEINAATAIPWVEAKLGIQLAENQKKAIATAIQSKFMVITGGPGVGKTTIVNSIIKILNAKQLQILLAAPTGRAAKRLSESTGLEAKTIHRLLEYDPSEHQFKRNEMNPLECQLLVIDETSMVDAQLMNSLLKAVPQNASIILVGDVNQLPSVGAGQILADIIDSECVTVVTLNEIFRQAKTSKIITSAHAINSGNMPDLSNQLDGDFFFVSSETPEDAVQKIIEIVKHRIPKRWHYNPITDVQILCPANIGGIGAKSLNIELQKVLNPHATEKVVKFGIPLATGDKVMQIQNNYDKEVFNGDIGFITSIDTGEKELAIQFDDRTVIYDFDELDEVVLAYACTIHKSQGSEYPVIVIPIMMQHFMMLQRNLIYTGVTRGKKLVILVGQKKALNIAVNGKKHNKPRYSKLKEWLVTLTTITTNPLSL